jgi:hypothetical protein
LEERKIPHGVTLKVKDGALLVGNGQLAFALLGSNLDSGADYLLQVFDRQLPVLWNLIERNR